MTVREEEYLYSIEEAGRSGVGTESVRQVATTQTEVTKKLNWSQPMTQVFNLESKLKQNE